MSSSREQTPLKDDLDYIGDVFNGYDGGRDFISITNKLYLIEKQAAEENNESAKEILLIVNRFVKLMKILV